MSKSDVKKTPTGGILPVYCGGPVSTPLVVATQLPYSPACKEDGFITNRPLKMK